MSRKKYKYNVGDIINNCKVLELITHKDSRGSNIKAYRMECLESKGIYEVKQYNLSYGHKSPYVSGHKVNEYNWLYNEKSILPYLKNKDDAKRYTTGTSKQITCKCPNCKKEKSISIKNLVSYGFTCDYCKPSKSYPELLVSSYLEVNSIKFISQYKILGNRFLDFYLPDYKIAIETHGLQHYEESYSSNWEHAYANSQKSDSLKREYCLNNDITLIEVDCKKSQFYYIRKTLNDAILNTSLPKLSVNDESEIKRVINLSRADREIEHKAMELYREGNLSIRSIESKLGLGNGTVANIAKKYGIFKSNKPHKKVKCLNNDIIYESMAEAQRKTGANASQIRKACKDSKYTAGIINGNKGKWCFVN